MLADAEMLKVTEAAVVSQVNLREVNRAIDDNVLPEGWFVRNETRRISSDACWLITFYVESAEKLTVPERQFAIHTIALRVHDRQHGQTDWIVRDGYLTIDFAPFVQRSADRLQRLTLARKLVETSDEILGSTPVIKGTRIPVYNIAAAIEAGEKPEELLRHYPALDREKIELAALYAEAYPQRGRPRRSLIFNDLETLSERRIERDSQAG